LRQNTGNFRISGMSSAGAVRSSGRCVACFGAVRRMIIFTILSLAAFLLLTSCASIQMSPIKSLEDSAETDFNEQKYEAAVAKFHHLYLNHPVEQKKEHYLIREGQSLYLLHSYHDAEVTFKQYISKYPDGTFRAEAETYLTKIEAFRREKDREEIIEIEKIRNDVDLMKSAVKEDPYNARVHYELANKLWELGEYNDSARSYLKAAEIDAALQENELIRNRLMINDKGDVVPITPDLQKEIQREKNPVVVFDTHSYEQRLPGGSSGVHKAFRTVTGKVRNQSRQVLRDVRVSVNFYNIHHDLLDTQSFFVGTMGPREVRAFLVKGRNYDTLSNIDQVECIPTYQ